MIETLIKPDNTSASPIQSAFVTGATGLLGNNLVRLLIEQGVSVKALVRSKIKAEQQFAGLPVDIIEGDMTNVMGFQAALQGCDALFHTAAHFRESYSGGKHWDQLYRINVEGTTQIMEAAYAAGIRRMVHTSSIAVLNGQPNQLIDESMARLDQDADEYYRSKILSERAVQAFLKTHPDMFIVMVLPGWIFGPGDIGPTSSGRAILDFVQRKIPGILPGSFSVVDARDVAAHQIAALKWGRNGERYLAAGQHMSMKELFTLVEKVTGVPAPKRQIPLIFLRILAMMNECYSWVSRKPVLLSLATVSLMVKEANRTHFSHVKSETELECHFRPVEETLKDVVTWYRTHGYLAHSE